MASAAHGVWAIDVGTNALKALQMDHGEEGIEVLDFAYLEHSKNLSSGQIGPGEKEQIIVETLHRFLEEKDLSKSEVAISIAGQNSFARFIKLPPVEAKKIPEVVQFEAVQQIPFDINEVEWDWQLMESEDSPDKTVGLFAIKNELISEVMDHFTNQNLRVTCVQIAPMALYNYACYDMKQIQQSSDNATIILDMGAENTTLVVCTKDSVWQRSIRIGGNTFTEAIADTFRKNYATSEKLKRTAPMSKYMRQIYTAMKSVYTDLGGEIQRSLGFYSSSPEGRNKKFTKVIALGGGVKLQGLCKYLTQTLGVTVVKPDTFESLKLAPDVSTAKFHENISDFGVAYGLGVQLLGEAQIGTNLLPRKIARAMAWTRKSRMFTVAASILLLTGLLSFGVTFMNLRQHSSYSGTRREIDSVISNVRGVSSEISNLKGKIPPIEAEIEKFKNYYQYRDVFPEFITTLAKCLPNKNNNPDQSEMYEAFEKGDIAALKVTERKDRKQLFITQFAVEYKGAVEGADFPSPNASGKGKSRSRMRRTGGGGAIAPVIPGRAPTIPGRDTVIPGRAPTIPGRAPTIPGRSAVTPGGASKKVQDDTTAVGGAGFTVLIEGYSPYKNIDELLDPPNVKNDRSRWGLVTRLENLKKLFPQVPFELYAKHDISHFDVDTGSVDLKDTKMPLSIGVLEEVERAPKPEKSAGAAHIGRGSDYIYTEKVLLDPMTGEEISRVLDIITQEDIDTNPDLTDEDLGRIEFNRLTQDEKYIENDQWFRIKAKFVWKDAPVDETYSKTGG